jgi:DNA modification methylase
MTATYTDPLVTLHVGDCLEVLPTLEADSVDAVVTDPPYGLGFMAKDWDNAKRMRSIPPSVATRIADGSDVGRLGNYPGGKGQAAVAFDGHAFQAWCEQWGREALRVTKPGGYLLAFGGTRTHHRLVCALEDAGWIIRDELDWIYASGFPKSKSNLKPAHEPIVLARKPGPLRPLGIDECRIGVSDDEPNHRGDRGLGRSAGGGGMYGHGEITEYQQHNGRWPSNVLLSDPELFDEPNPYVVGSGATSVSGARSGEYEGSEAWSGPFGPVSQDIEGSAGGYSRFFIIPKADRAERERGLNHGATAAADNRDRPGIAYQGQSPAPPSTEVRAESAFSIVCAKCNRQKVNVPGAACKCPDPEWVRKSRTARLNLHPTVKPIDLMRHLVRLVTPPGGVVLDPFLGSGTTCLAASEEGFRSIGIEREVEYLEIAKGRLMATPMGFSWGEVPA